MTGHSVWLGTSNLKETDMISKDNNQREIRIELLALDLSACGRCMTTSKNIDSALEEMAKELIGDDVTFDRVVVSSAAQAEELRFAASPTIRINGQDIASETRMTPCSDCGDQCGCGIDCRAWVWDGKSHNAAPVPMIVDAIRRSLQSSPKMRARDARFELPDNLKRYFAGTKLGRSATACCEESCCTPAAA
jgi:hypothetical protein